MHILFRRLTDNARQPTKATPLSAGWDLHAAEAAVIVPGQRKLIRTGIALELTDFHEAQVRPRSGLALKYGITVLNSPGTIDADYRGEISVILINHGDKPFIIDEGDRIAQLVFSRVAADTWTEVTSLKKTQRGCGGFGSTDDYVPEGF